MKLRAPLTRDQRATQIARKIAAAGIQAELERVKKTPQFADMEPGIREAVQTKVQQIVTFVRIGDLSAWVG
jgi:hypothetical protein